LGGSENELWKNGTADDHRAFATAALEEPIRLVAFLTRDADGLPVGFLEASLRFDYVNGCSTSPVGFLQGLYVRVLARCREIARGLVAAVERWARERATWTWRPTRRWKMRCRRRRTGVLAFARQSVVFFRKSLDIPDIQ